MRRLHASADDDFQPRALFVVAGPAHEEACDLRKHLRAIVDQVSEIPGDLVERPRTVGDGDTDVVVPLEDKAVLLRRQ